MTLVHEKAGGTDYDFTFQGSAYPNLGGQK